MFPEHNELEFTHSTINQSTNAGGKAKKKKKKITLLGIKPIKYHSSNSFLFILNSKRKFQKQRAHLLRFVVINREQNYELKDKKNKTLKSVERY